MLDKVSQTPWVKSFVDYKKRHENDLLYRVTRACAVITLLILAVSAVAAAIFFVGPYMGTVALATLTAAKWMAIITAGSALFYLAFLCCKKAYEVLQFKLSQLT
jgi:hypothetical protein